MPLTYALSNRSSAPAITPGKGETLDPYTDWDTSEGAPFSVISRQMAVRPETVTDDYLLSVGGTPAEVIVAPMTGPRPVPTPPRRLSRLPVPTKSVRLSHVAGDLATDIPSERAGPTHALHDGAIADDMVITAVLDTGINPLNARFRYGPGNGTLPFSRCEYLWVQDAPSAPGEQVQFGRTWARVELEAIMATQPDDEALWMTHLGLIPNGVSDFGTARRALGHGTHVLDLAAGYAAEDSAAAKDHRIIAVELPELVTADTSGSTLYGMTVAGLHYIFDRAEQICIAADRPVPLVVNFSFGLGAGPLDGTHPIETALRAHLAAYIARIEARFPPGKGDPEVCADIVLPAGNRRLAQCHARTSGQDGQAELGLQWITQPEDLSSNYLEFWAPSGARMTRISLTPPGRDTSLVWDIPAGDTACKDITLNCEVIGRITLDRPYADDASSDRNLRLHIALAGTENYAGAHVAEPGRWRITVTAENVSDDAGLHAWVQRDDQALGLWTGGRPSYFDDAAYEEKRRLPQGEWRVTDPKCDPFSTIHRAGTISSMATRPKHHSPIEDRIHVIGGKFQCFDTKIHLQANMAAYSGLGEQSGMPDPISGPSDVEASDRSIMRGGQIGAGMRSGSAMALSGTSVAAPIYARGLLGRNADTLPYAECPYETP
ncbi:hypothetical protein V8J82_12955 [Gymnodinialimonas sp. 2305UL16-5]|uniref:hypothetical protein n=1 Tax=Gymnodinialimonas mytili TaxID=3126503 RepID=UPI0030A7544E